METPRELGQLAKGNWGKHIMASAKRSMTKQRIFILIRGFIDAGLV